MLTSRFSFDWQYLISAVIDATSLLLSGVISSATYLNKILDWWMGDTLGVIVITPFVLSWWQVRNVDIQRKQAEGVESEEHLAFLRKQGCDMYQGYLSSKPLSATDFQTFLIDSANSV